jgi:hypothetical protein
MGKGVWFRPNFGRRKQHVVAGRRRGSYAGMLAAAWLRRRDRDQRSHRAARKDG